MKKIANILKIAKNHGRDLPEGQTKSNIFYFIYVTLKLFSKSSVMVKAFVEQHYKFSQGKFKWIFFYNEYIIHQWASGYVWPTKYLTICLWLPTKKKCLFCYLRFCSLISLLLTYCYCRTSLFSFITISLIFQ